MRNATLAIRKSKNDFKQKIKDLNKDQIIFLSALAATSIAGASYTSHRVNQ